MESGQASGQLPKKGGAAGPARCYLSLSGQRKEGTGPPTGNQGVLYGEPNLTVSERDANGTYRENKPLGYPSALLIWRSKTCSQLSIAKGLDLYNEPKLMELVSLAEWSQLRILSGNVAA
ncbi:hypothetical protein DUI87_05874 [Hirundo rustica rustica]|uniref:Uncharacterized protein n=1 Tax=Hirundo rustica rustica TaxID=333673 RepID=A0A3M0KVV5_HIRRU|nr:hypothetical protein DUI87_05874 [Hirundo rustica rustica]